MDVFCAACGERVAEFVKKKAASGVPRKRPILQHWQRQPRPSSPPSGYVAPRVYRLGGHASAKKRITRLISYYQRSFDGAYTIFVREGRLLHRGIKRGKRACTG